MQHPMPTVQHPMPPHGTPHAPPCSTPHPMDKTTMGVPLRALYVAVRLGVVVGVPDGDAEGVELGELLGVLLGVRLGLLLGEADGLLVGEGVGDPVLARPRRSIPGPGEPFSNLCRPERSYTSSLGPAGHRATNKVMAKRALPPVSLPIERREDRGRARHKTRTRTARHMMDALGTPTTQPTATCFQRVEYQRRGLVGVLLGDAEGLAVGVPLGLEDGLGLGLGDRLGVLLGVPDGEADGVELGELLGVALGEWVADGVLVGDVVGDTDAARPAHHQNRTTPNGSRRSQRLAIQRTCKLVEQRTKK